MHYKYTIHKPDGSERVFDLKLDPKTLLIEPVPGTKPEWAKLDYFQCPACPLTPSASPHCPIAANIAGLYAALADVLSTDQVEMRVDFSDGRQVRKTAPSQEGIYSILGVYMAASGCPVMDKLKPMVATHLPFSSVEETVYRVMTMYLAAQYFRMEAGKTPDWTLAGLIEMYGAIRNVNAGFSERLRSAAKTDSILNSIVNLDMFAMVVLDTPESLSTLRPLFESYVKN
ncbi:MAG TPA: hypothetical protein PLL10_01295 [Elusimicrobiales bacterium]|nr:hypothetical protein [Elusimicrobiales bacterium]